MKIGSMRISKKLTAAVLGVVLVVLQDVFGLDLSMEQLLAMLSPLLVYIGGQSLVDAKHNGVPPAAKSDEGLALAAIAEAVKVKQLLYDPVTRAEGRVRLAQYDATYGDYANGVLLNQISQAARAL